MFPIALLKGKEYVSMEAEMSLQFSASERPFLDSSEFMLKGR